MGGIKILLALLMMYGGVVTALSTPGVYPTEFGWFFSSRLTLVTYGLLLFVPGATLMYGKIKGRRRWVGRSLMAIYLVVLFAMFSEWLVLGSLVTVVDNIVVAVIAAGLWLWWKFKTEYITAADVIRLKKEVAKMNDHERPAS